MTVRIQRFLPSVSLLPCVINFYELEADIFLVMCVRIGRKESGDDYQRLARTGNAFSVLVLRCDRCKMIRVDTHA